MLSGANCWRLLRLAHLRLARCDDRCGRSFLRPQIAQGKANASHDSPNQTKDWENQQIHQGQDKGKLGHLLVKVAHRSNEGWANSHQHDEETYHGNNEQQQTADFKQQAGESDEQEETALSWQAARLFGNQYALRGHTSTHTSSMKLGFSEKTRLLIVDYGAGV